MSRNHARWLIYSGLALSGCLGSVPAEEASYPDPDRFESEVQAFEKRDAASLPSKGGIVFFGSSTFALWHDNITSDLAPLTVIPRGFGGSTMHDAVHYADRLVIPYHPRAVVIYEGDNDIASGISPATVVERYDQLVGKLRSSLPELRIYFVSIKPSFQRWSMWEQMQEVNRQISLRAEEDPAMRYIDLATIMFDSGGNLRRELYQEDGLHLSRAGYELWRDALKPTLVEAEGRYEARAAYAR